MKEHMNLRDYRYYIIAIARGGSQFCAPNNTNTLHRCEILKKIKTKQCATRNHLCNADREITFSQWLNRQLEHHWYIRKQTTAATRNH